MNENLLGSNSIPYRSNPMNINQMLSGSTSAAPAPLLAPIPVPGAVNSLNRPEEARNYAGQFNGRTNGSVQYPSLPTAFNRESGYAGAHNLNRSGVSPPAVVNRREQINSNLIQFSQLPNQINLQSRVRWEEAEKLRKRSAGEMSLKRVGEQLERGKNNYNLLGINQIELGINKLIKIDSIAIKDYLTNNSLTLTHSIIFSSIYNPLLEPSTALNHNLLKRNIGKYFYTTFNLSTLIGNTRQYHIQSPKTPFTIPQPLQLSNQLFNLKNINNRAIWGTEVYTDDSDLLAILIHSGWCRISIPTTPVIHKKEEESVRVKFLIGPSLLRYQGTFRQGIQSRNWGNGHDGVSLMIDSVEFIQTPPKPRAENITTTTGPAYSKKLAGQFVTSTLLSPITTEIEEDDLIGEEIIKEEGEEEEFRRRCLNSSIIFEFGKEGGREGGILIST